jgi:hypothetical protein
MSKEKEKSGKKEPIRNLKEKRAERTQKRIEKNKVVEV